MLRFAVLFCLLATPLRADYVLSNLRLTLYHEVGHAVIDQMQVQPFGPEETAADGFAMLLAHRLHSETELRRMVQDATRLARAEAENLLFDPWDEYMTGPQRLAHAICLYYGLRPDVRGPVARALGMPAESEDACVARAEVVAAAWAPVLARMAPGGGRSLQPERIGKTLRLLAKDIDRLNGHLTLPRPVPVQVASCGEDNAYYYHGDERILFCTEMLKALRRSARR
ncbi:DUF4344 domain-containing metallopeptidase [Jannaschia sp. M317]|uniref:DUF4344 domain-containing metallopeptidase n=1 Tax=Jannaschia sp. M317 TaxID=2867011 RepID=UPI0021A76D17|nr:DUF4344 domain-containing metallopeptidase [Jannaschia sp. M317]UWQ18020.1 DUF4344 domain-containing metallopeptidase [Jannaschia sp. M317]